MSPAVAASCIMPKIRGMAAMECSKVCGAGIVPCSLVPNTRLAGAERGLFQALLCESWKKSLEGPLPSIIKDFLSVSFS